MSGCQLLAIHCGMLFKLKLKTIIPTLSTASNVAGLLKRNNKMLRVAFMASQLMSFHQHVHQCIIIFICLFS